MTQPYHSLAESPADAAHHLIVIMSKLRPMVDIRIAKVVKVVIDRHRILRDIALLRSPQQVFTGRSVRTGYIPQSVLLPEPRQGLDKLSLLPAGLSPNL